MLVKTLICEECPHLLADKAWEKRQIDPILPMYGEPWIFGIDHPILRIQQPIVPQVLQANEPSSKDHRSPSVVDAEQGLAWWSGGAPSSREQEGGLKSIGERSSWSPSLGLGKEEINPSPTTPRRASNKASRRGRHLPVLSFSLTKNQGRTGLAISLCRGAALERGALICVHRAIWAWRGESTQFSIVTRYGAQVSRVRNGLAGRQLRASHWAQNATDSFNGKCHLPYLLVAMLSISLTEIHTTHAFCIYS